MEDAVDVPPGWSVVIWATVTPDLDEAFLADLREATLALETIDPGDVHVHVIETRPGTSGPTLQRWAPPVAIPNDVDSVATLGQALANARCWTTERPVETKRLLVLWGHGELFFPSAAPSPAVAAAGELSAPGGAASLAVLTAEELVRELPPIQPQTASEAAGTPPPDIIGYDACRMATVSNVETLADAYREAVFIGSMVPEPASGWPYVQLLRILRDTGSSKAVAAAIVEAYAASVDVPEWCLVAVSLAEVAALRGALDALAGSTPPGRVEFFDAAAGADILDDTNLLDLGALMRRLGRFEANPEAEAVRGALRLATLARRAAGILGGRDGLATRAGLPPSRALDLDWPPEPEWSAYLPDLFPTKTAPASTG